MRCPSGSVKFITGKLVVHLLQNILGWPKPSMNLINLLELHLKHFTSLPNLIFGINFLRVFREVNAVKTWKTFKGVRFELKILKKLRSSSNTVF
jgi:hypothetical protein